MKMMQLSNIVRSSWTDVVSSSLIITIYCSRNDRQHYFLCIRKVVKRLKVAILYLRWLLIWNTNYKLRRYLNYNRCWMRFFVDLWLKADSGSIFGRRRYIAAMIDNEGCAWQMKTFELKHCSVLKTTTIVQFEHWLLLLWTTRRED
jgi:hypothetical protein